MARRAATPYIVGVRKEPFVTKTAANDSAMKPSDFKRWRKSLKLSQKDAAEVVTDQGGKKTVTDLTGGNGASQQK